MRWDLTRLALQAARRTWRSKRLKNRAENLKISMFKNNTFLVSILERFGCRLERIFGKFLGRKMDAKSDVEKRCEKIRKKWLWARILVLLAAFWAARAAPGAAQERPKSGSRRPQELGKSEARALCDALGRSWALFLIFSRFCLKFCRFWIDFCYEKLCNDLYHFALLGGVIPRWPNLA